MKEEDECTERVKVVYVVSRMVEFIELGGGEAIVHQLKRLQELIQRDRMQSEESYARATSTKLLSAVQKPAENRWQSATGRRAMPAERPRVPCVPVANQFAALSDDQEQSDQGSNAGSTAGSGGSSTASKVLDWLRDLAEGKRRRERRRPNQRIETQDQNDQRRQTVEVREKLHGGSRWQEALAAQRLSQQIWDKQIEQTRLRRAAVRIQCLVRRRLASMAARDRRREGAARRLQSWIRRMQPHYKQEPEKAGAVGPAAPTEDELIQMAIQRSQAEEAARIAMLTPILAGTRKAMGLMDSNLCPEGHTLKASIEPAGTTCCICNTTMRELEVVILCEGGKGCGFTTCCRGAECAPRDINRVVKALDMKFKMLC